LHFTLSELERFHLRAITETDFVWLYAPDGYVGLSGAFEIGYATAVGRPVFCHQRLQDDMLDAQVHHVGSVFEALEQLADPA
jgi:hypothetical protein